MPSRTSKDWGAHRLVDPAQRGGTPPPDAILFGGLPSLAPMLATSGRPTGSLDGWTAEPKADGWRAQVAIDGDGVVVRTRTGVDITAKVSELTPLTDLGVDCVPHGEIVAGAGLPSDFYGIAGLSAAASAQRPVLDAALTNAVGGPHEDSAIQLVGSRARAATSDAESVIEANKSSSVKRDAS